MSQGRARGSGIVAFLLAALVGCQTDSLRAPSITNNADVKRDLMGQLDDWKGRWNEAKGQVDQAVAQVSQLQKQLDGQKDVQSLLTQRVENLLRENQQLHQELTAVVMNAAGDAAQSPLVQNVSNTLRESVSVPDDIARQMRAIADHHPGIQFDPEEGVVRIAATELFSQGDELRPASRELLRDLAEVFNSPAAKRFNFLVVAHATPNSSVPKELVTFHPTTWHMTAHQAIAVEQYLEESGLNPTRVGIVSYGGQQPLVEGGDEASKRTNARVEIFFTPPDPASR